MRVVRRMRPSVALVVAFAALVVALAGNAGAFTGNSAGAAGAGNVVVVKGTSATIHPGDSGGKFVKCPAGYTVFGGAYVIDGVRAIPFLVGPVRKENAYEVDLANPPANPLAGLPGEDDTVLVAAYCARTGQPIVMPHN
jgi:hypothetical protein